MSPERQLPRIRLRFTALYAATLLVVLLAAAAALRFAVRDALEREFEESVRASALLMRQFFRVEIAEYQTIEGTLEHIAGELVFEDRSIRVRRPDGVLFQTFGAPVRNVARTIAEPVRRVALPLEPGLAPGWSIEVTASAASLRAVQSRIDFWFMLGIPGAVLLAAVAGWWLTGRTLRPVGQMADAAGGIVPGSRARLPVDDPTDELGRLGRSFNALLDRLDGALQQQRRFLADAAHELRTPLARMRARVDVAQLGAADGSARTSAVVAELHEDLIRMSRQVDELMQLARADAGDDAAAHSLLPLFLDDLVADELRRWHHDAARAGLVLESTTLDEARVLVEPTLISRLIGILLDNALRYGHRGGHVDVRVFCVGTEAVLEVQDDGLGIPAAERSRVFDRFYRGDAARVHRSDGSGLGLAIAAWIVARHGGRIGVDAPDSGVGTVVTVRLPGRAAAAPGPRATPPATSPATALTTPAGPRATR